MPFTYVETSYPSGTSGAAKPVECRFSSTTVSVVATA
jgi:hypothetical protein